jgi:hypothetical protein
LILLQIKEKEAVSKIRNSFFIKLKTEHEIREVALLRQSLHSK